MKGVTHYTKKGVPFKGKTHKMPNGQLHSGAKHTKLSQRLFDFEDLPNSVKIKIKKGEVNAKKV
jgi:hypothetical protein